MATIRRRILGLVALWLDLGLVRAVGVDAPLRALVVRPDGRVGVGAGIRLGAGLGRLVLG